MRTQEVSRFGRPRRLAVALALLGLAAGGCAARSGWGFSEEPGVPASVEESHGERFAGTLIAYEKGAFVVDRSFLRGEGLEVVRKGGVDYVSVNGVVSGTAVEVRNLDVVTRQRIPAASIRELDIKVRGYIGWGSVIGGVLMFSLIQVLEGLEY